MDQTKLYPVKLKSGDIIAIEMIFLGEEEISSRIETIEFNTVTGKIKALSQEIVDSIKDIELNKISVKFGIEIGVETGGLTAYLVKGTGKANLEITLEWNKE